MTEAEKYMIGEQNVITEPTNSESKVSAEQINDDIEKELRGLSEDEVIAFVDGIYS